MGDQDDVEQAQFNAFIASKVGTANWFILEPDASGAALLQSRRAVLVTRKQFDKWKEEYEARQ